MKKNYIILTVLVVLISLSAKAQTHVIQARPVELNWGYIDLKGNFLIEPQFRRCIEFSESGYAAIYGKKSGYYFIDINGEVLPTEIEKIELKNIVGVEIQGFNEGLVQVEVDELWGYMNTDGKLAIKPKYTKTSNFIDGHATVKIDTNFYVIDKQGNEKLIEVPGLVNMESYSEGLASFKNREGLHGFINLNGNVVVEAKYVRVGKFVAGLALAKTSVGTIGYINKEGEWTIRPLAMTAFDFNPDVKLARIKHNGEWFYMDTEGNKTPLNDSEICSEFYDGLAKGKKYEKVGFYDTNMEWVIKPRFEAAREFKNGYAAAKSRGKWGIIDKQGNWVIEPKFAGIKDVEIIK